MFRTSFLALVASSIVTASLAQSAADGRLSGTADYALINAQVYTVNEDQRWAEAVAIEGDTITYVGDAQDLKSYIGISTEVIDLEGAMILPGFIDAHTHAVVGGIINTGVDLQSDDLEVLLDRIRQYVAENPDDEVIRGYGVRFNPWTDGWPTAAMLDEIEADRPLFFFAIDGHKAWVNSKALEIAGIDKDTPDTVPGFSFFERDADGNPTGWIVETPAFMQVLSALVDLKPEEIRAGTASWAERFAAAGITAVQDYGFTGIGDATGLKIMQDLERSGDLTYRVQSVFYWNDPSIDPVSEFEKLQKLESTELVRPAAIKINMDGGDDSWNALFVEPYADRPDINVNPIIPAEVLNNAVMRADAAGINLVCHCFGDLAVRMFLDAVELAIAANPDRERRNNVASHAVLVHPDDVARFVELGVTYDTSGAWMSLDPLLKSATLDRLGETRRDRMLPMQVIAETGANVSLGSDWPVSGYVSEFRPLVHIRTAVTRRLPGRDNEPPLGGESALVSLSTAIRAQTLGAAIGIGLDNEIGSIEVGKKADIVVLSENLYEIDPSTIHEVDVLYTMMGGRLTFDHTLE